MTANEQHTLTVKACIDEIAQILPLLNGSLAILEATEPPRRDSIGHDIGRLNLRIYGQLSQAREAAHMLATLLQRQREGR